MKEQNAIFWSNSSRRRKREMSQHLFIIKVPVTCCFCGNLHVREGHCTRTPTHGVWWPCVMLVLRLHMLEPGLLVLVFGGRIRGQVHGDHLTQVPLWRRTTRIPTPVLTLDGEDASRRPCPRSRCVEPSGRRGNGLRLDAAATGTVRTRLHRRWLVGWPRTARRVHAVRGAVHVGVWMHLPHVVSRVPACCRRHVAAVGWVVLLVCWRVVVLHDVAIWHVAVRHLVHVTPHHLLHSRGCGGRPRGVRPR